MNRIRPAWFLVLSASLLCVLAAVAPREAHAQYMYLDANGDGVHTAADVLNPTGVTHLAVWLDTQHDRDGSLRGCNAHTGAPHHWEQPPDPGMNFFSYDFRLLVSGGTVVWGHYVDLMEFEEPPTPVDVVAPDKLVITRFSWPGDEKPPGLYKIGEVSVSVELGRPSISFGEMWGPELTQFGTHCSGSEYPNTYLYGVDWLDADGIAYGGVVDGPYIDPRPSFDPISAMSVVEGMVLDQTVTASDNNSRSITFSKAGGPAFVTVTTLNPGSGHATGQIHAAPGATDVGSATVIVRADNGAFQSDRAITITVRPELQLGPLFDLTAYEGTHTYRSIPVENPLGQALSFYIASGPPFITVSGEVSSPPVDGGRLTISPTLEHLGKWELTLGVTNGKLHDEKTITVEVLRSGVNRRPTSVPGGPYVGIVGRPILFDGSRSSDPDGDALNYRWNFGDGTGGVGQSAAHVYTWDGNFVVDLIARDPDFMTLAFTTARVTSHAPARAYLATGESRNFAGHVHRDVSVRVEPVGALFTCEELDVAKVTLSSTAGAVREIRPTGFDASIESDVDRNGVADRGLVFSEQDLTSLLESVRGGGRIELSLRGDLGGGGRFVAPLGISAAPRGGPLAAGVSPNPFNPVGELSFVTTRPGRVDVRVFNVSGRLAYLAVNNEVLPAGIHRVTIGRGDSGKELGSGVYFYRIVTEEGVARGRFAVAR